MEDGGPSLAAIAAQFRAQLAAVSALQAGSLPSEATVLAACGGRVPQAAVSKLLQVRGLALAAPLVVRHPCGLLPCPALLQRIQRRMQP